MKNFKSYPSGDSEAYGLESLENHGIIIPEHVFIRWSSNAPTTYTQYKSLTTHLTQTFNTIDL